MSRRVAVDVFGGLKVTVERGRDVGQEKLFGPQALVDSLAHNRSVRAQFGQFPVVRINA